MEFLSEPSEEALRAGDAELLAFIAANIADLSHAKVLRDTRRWNGAR
jgi:hypothetical protein